MTLNGILLTAHSHWLSTADPGPSSETSVTGPLYGADLVGGCLRSVLTSTLLIPPLGIPQTCLAVGLAGLVVLV